MKRLSFILTLLLATAGFTTATAQTVFFKVGGGFASQWGADGVQGSARIALGYEYEFNQKLAFAPSIGFVGRGWQIADCDTPDMLFDDKGNMLDADGNVTLDPAKQAQRLTPTVDADGKPLLNPDGSPVKGDPMFSVMHRTYSANYLQLDLPFNYYIRTGERRYVTLTAGPWLAYGIAGKRNTEGDGRQEGGRKFRYTDPTFSLDGAHRFDCGLKAGFGYQFPSALTINLEGEFGLLKTNSIRLPQGGTKPLPAYADDFGARAGRNFNIVFTVAYKLNKSKWKDDDE